VVYIRKGINVLEVSIWYSRSSGISINVVKSGRVLSGHLQLKTGQFESRRLLGSEEETKYIKEID